MSRPPRRLFLHLSALSDEEYNTYISALRDVIDDEHEIACASEQELENRVLGVREVRAWMKGRYRDVHDIDKVLRLFSPDLLQKDTISGGQFLAVLRLVMHARNGGEISEGNVFVQATPMSPTASAFASLPSTNMSTAQSTQSPERTNPFRLEQAPNPSTLPSRRQSLSHPPSTSQLGPASSSSDVSHDANPTFPSSSSKPSSVNPFLQRSKSSAGSTSSANALGRAQGRTPPLPPRKPQQFSAKASANVASGSASIFSTSPSKPAIIPTPQRVPTHPHRDRDGASLQPQSSLTSSSLVSPLMKQSLEASKMGQAVKKVQDQLEKERVLEVIKSSSGPSTSRGRLPTDNRIFGNGQHVSSGLAHRPVPSPPRSLTGTSVSMSVMSFDQVASATVPTSISQRHHSPDRMTSSSRSSTKPSMDLPPPQHPSSHQSNQPQSQNINQTHNNLNLNSHIAPPTHPDRRPDVRRTSGHRHTSSLYSSWPSPVDTTTSSAVVTDSQQGSPTSTGGARAGRSQSMHQPTTTKSGTSGSTSGRSSPPLPPPRRQRPESVQVLPSPRSAKYASGSENDALSPFANVFRVGGAGKDASPTRDGETTTLSALTRQLALSAPASGRTTSPERPGLLSSASHHGSPSASTTTSTSTSASNHLSFSALQRTFSQLQSKAQPKLDRARYKAEAGLSRRGYVRDDGGGPILRDVDGYDDGGGGYRDEIDYARKGRDAEVGSEEDSWSEGSERDGRRGMPMSASALAGRGATDKFEDKDDPFSLRKGRSRSASGGREGSVGGGGVNGRMRRLTREDVGMDDLKLPEGEGWTRL